MEKERGEREERERREKSTWTVMSAHTSHNLPHQVRAAAGINDLVAAIYRRENTLLLLIWLVRGLN